MSTENTPASPAPKSDSHNPLKNKALELDEVPEVLEFLKENGTSILIGAIVAAAVFLGWSTYRNVQNSKANTAANRLFSAQSAEGVQQIITEFPNTPSAPLAQLLLASQAFDQGQYEVAQNLFAQFIERYPQHELSDTATLGISQCLEASGRYAEAFDAYSSFIAAHPSDYLLPSATFGAARSLEFLGRFDEAEKLYETFIEGRPEDDNWRARAQSSLELLKRDNRARARGETVTLLPPQTPAFSFPGLDQTAPVLAPDLQNPTAP